MGPMLGTDFFLCEILAMLYSKRKLKRSMISMDWNGFVAQLSQRSDFPLPQADLSYGICLGYAKSGKSVEDRGNLPIEVTRREALTEQFHTMHPLPGINDVPGSGSSFAQELVNS